MKNCFTVMCCNISPRFSFALNFSSWTMQNTGTQGAWLWEGLHRPQPPSPGPRSPRGLQEFFLLLVFGLTDRPAPQVIKLLPERAWCVRIWLFQDNSTGSSALTVAVAGGQGKGPRGEGRPLEQKPAWYVGDLGNDEEISIFQAAGELDISNIY